MPDSKSESTAVEKEFKPPIQGPPGLLYWSDNAFWRSYKASLGFYVRSRDLWWREALKRRGIPEAEIDGAQAEVASHDRD